MDLLSNLKEGIWINISSEEKTGFQDFRIAKRAKEGPDHYSYAVFDNYGNLQTVHLEDANDYYDPLHNINNCEMRAVQNENDGSYTVVGICVEDDIVLKKCMIQNESPPVATSADSDGNVIKENSIEEQNLNGDNMNITQAQNLNEDIIVSQSGADLHELKMSQNKADSNGNRGNTEGQTT